MSISKKTWEIESRNWEVGVGGRNEKEEEAASGRVGRAAGHPRFIGGWC
jgi:hypothetical protein